MTQPAARAPMTPERAAQIRGHIAACATETELESLRASLRLAGEIDGTTSYDIEMRRRALQTAKGRHR